MAAAVARDAVAVAAAAQLGRLHAVVVVVDVVDGCGVTVELPRGLFGLGWVGHQHGGQQRGVRVLGVNK